MTYEVDVVLRSAEEMVAVFRWCEEEFTPREIIQVTGLDAGTPRAVAVFRCQEAAMMFRLRWG